MNGKLIISIVLSVLLLLASFLLYTYANLVFIIIADVIGVSLLIAFLAAFIYLIIGD